MGKRKIEKFLKIKDKNQRKVSKIPLKEDMQDSYAVLSQNKIEMALTYICLMLYRSHSARERRGY